ncbi:hypothetical protein [Tenacibaculum ovolyticum]|uniref:hypothetical protein n=1 Tax=Tenacibaculum ovolyticum TaxID=104270 RepID=UPI000425B04F|nr:hypothetical protein [Tenacibaculum ovolyticum]
MKKTDLSGLKSLKHQVKIGNEPQLVLLKNVSPDALLKVEISRQDVDDQKLFNPLSVGMVLEAQNKIEALTTGRAIKIFSVKEGSNAANQPVDVIEQAVIDVAYGGEIALAQNDTVDIGLSSLSSIQDSSMLIFGGLNDSPFPYVISEKTYNADRNEEEVSFVDGQFIIIPIDSIPTEIEIKRNGKKQILDAESLKHKAIDDHGVIGYDKTEDPIYGFLKCIVLDVRNLDSVTFEDESEPRKDIKYYMVNTPY